MRTLIISVLLLLIGFINAIESSKVNSSIVKQAPLTVVNYNGTQLKVYEATTNDIHNPRRMTFYYEPILNSTSSDLRIANKEVRVSLVVGNDEVKRLVLEEVKKKFEPSVATLSPSWTVAPIMFDSVVAYIVKSADTPVANVHPSHEKQQNALKMELRFLCTDKQTAEETKSKLLQGTFQIEAIFSFTGIGNVGKNSVPITAGQLKHIFQKTATVSGEMQIEWTGKTLQVKSLTSFKLTDLPEEMQMKLVKKQLIADKKQGVMIVRTVNLKGSGPLPIPESRLPGEICLFAGERHPSESWLLCDGSAVSRQRFQRLFKVIGVTYGGGDGNTTFNLPNLRPELESHVPTNGPAVYIINSGVDDETGSCERNEETKKPKQSVSIMSCEEEAGKKFCSRPSANRFSFHLCNRCTCVKGNTVCTLKACHTRVKSCNEVFKKLEKKYKVHLARG